MTRPVRLSCFLAAALAFACAASALVPVGAGEGPKAEKKGEPTLSARKARPLLGKYCSSCHGAKKPRAGLNLESLPPEKAASTWKRVWARMKARQMPPSDRPQPTAEEREQVLSWIEDTYANRALDGHPDPGPLRPRRLNVREHRNTFRDLVVVRDWPRPRRAAYVPRKNGTVNLYDSIVPPPEHPCAFVTRILPPDTSDGGFDTISENLSIPPFLLERYLRCSKALLDDLFTLNPGRGESYRWALCNDLTRLQKGPLPKGKTRAQAVRGFLKDFASRAFRRPVSAEEVEKYARLFDQAVEKGEDFETAIRLPLEAILVSSRFVVLWADVGAEAPRKGAGPVRPLDDHEMATRLSYFLWSSLPDRELFLAAQKGALRDPKALERQARWMLKDRRVTDGLLEGFLCQWLQLDRLDRNAPDAARYPAYFKENLGELMKQELLLFVDALMVEDRSILELIDADWGFLCFPLAQHYEVKVPGKRPPSNAQPPWYRVKFPDKRRGGVLTMGKVLTGTSQPVRTSPVHRGKWVLETILGTPPPPPPPDVNNQLAEEKEGKKELTVPQRLARHRNNPACSSCHQMIDPLGMAFETFDPVGRWRDRDQGQPIDARGALVDGKKFNGIVELKALLLSRKEEFVRSFVEQMLAYALGRKLELSDAATVKQITRAVILDDCKLSRVVVEVVKSYPFRYRRANGGRVGS
jgi:hypothetical protein